MGRNHLAQDRDQWQALVNTIMNLFLIGIVGGGVQFGPLGTVATNWPIVPTPGDYNDGEIGGTIVGRRSLPQCHFIHHKPHMLCPDANPGRRGGKPATNRLSYVTAANEP
jgi:hypothetical protein